MAVFEIKNLNFTYPNRTTRALEDIDFKIDRGEFIAICGKSGSGKSTFLRQLKPSLTPFGSREGTINYQAKAIEDISDLEDVKIGYVFQNPDNQIVTDKVWHELAFTLENLGYDRESIRLKVGEMASFFGIQNWFHKSTKDLSGGQKQILNLASVMVVDPDVLILDEPTSQLDPIASRDFLDMLKRINDDLGTTIILSEHRLDDVFPLLDRVLVLDGGRLAYDGSLNGLVASLGEDEIFKSFPISMQLYMGLNPEGNLPVTVREGREYLDRQLDSIDLSLEDRPKNPELVLEMRECFYKYNKKDRDIVSHASIEIEKSTIHSILGGNGTGKSTSLYMMAGVYKPYRGRIINKGGKTLMLPQNPELIFVGKTVLDELRQVEEDESILYEYLDKFELKGLEDFHPYDLSGGEKQKLALAKVLLKSPDILLLDEVTKGLDGGFKEKLGGYLRGLANNGVTIVLVSHDIEFCARYSDRASLFFDGKIVASNSSREFFSGNNFYTTKINRMARDFNSLAITIEDVVEFGQLKK